MITAILKQKVATFGLIVLASGNTITQMDQWMSRALVYSLNRVMPKCARLITPEPTSSHE